jgi:hypothetical protein
MCQNLLFALALSKLDAPALRFEEFGCALYIFRVM